MDCQHCCTNCRRPHSLLASLRIGFPILQQFGEPHLHKRFLDQFMKMKIHIKCMHHSTTHQAESTTLAVNQSQNKKERGTEERRGGKRGRKGEGREGTDEHQREKEKTTTGQGETRRAEGREGQERRARRRRTGPKEKKRKAESRIGYECHA